MPRGRRSARRARRPRRTRSRAAAGRESRASARVPSSLRARVARAGPPPTPAGTRSGGRTRDRAQVRRLPSLLRARAATSAAARVKARRRRETAAPLRRVATRTGPLACTTCLHPSQEAARHVFHSDERVGRGVRPRRWRARERERPRLVAECVDRRVGRKGDPAPLGLEVVLVDESTEQHVLLESAPEAGCADDLRLSVERRGHAKAPLAGRPLDWLVPFATRRIRRLAGT